MGADWKMKTRVDRLIFLGWIFAMTYAIAAIAGIEILSTTDMRVWKFRMSIFQSLGWCCLVHIGLTFIFLAMRKWVSAICASVFLSLFFSATVIEGLTMGPNLDMVRQEIANATGSSPLSLECIGGRLSREAVIVFKIIGNAPINDAGEIVPVHSNMRTILADTLRSVDVHSEEPSSMEIKKIPMGFNTVFALCTSQGRWMIFFGNTVM